VDERRRSPNAIGENPNLKVLDLNRPIREAGMPRAGGPKQTSSIRIQTSTCEMRTVPLSGRTRLETLPQPSMRSFAHSATLV
jgi:hypothetical protein